MLAAGRVSEAEKLAKSAVRTLEKGGEQSLLAEALTTQGIAQARSHDQTSARATLERAIDVAQQAGDPESAGQAALTLLEELGQQLCNEDICAILKRASELLEKSQDMNTLRRLLNCAFRVFFLIQAFPEPPNWSSFEFKQTVRRFEAGLIKRALQEAGGSVTRAAYLLGFGHHQTLVSLLNSRHKNLQNARRPVKPRKRKQPAGGVTPGATAEGRSKDVRPIRILHVEDNEAIARTVKEALNLEGWKVETCLDGAAARERLAGQSRFDLLLLDYDLAKIKGSQLIQYAHRLPHRRQTPIVILSASLDEANAARLGANAFLAKPVRMEKIVQTIARLLRLAADKSLPEGRRPG
jgi:CheY-like chemotaxis protein